VNRDPIEYDSGDVNIYSYVFNSPCYFTDILGYSILGLNVVDLSVSATYNFPKIPIPNPILPGLTISCSVTVNVIGKGLCCKKCNEYEYIHVSISGSCAGQIGKSMQKPKPDYNERDERGRLKKLPPLEERDKPPGDYDNTGWGGGAGGGPGNGGCPKPGFNVSAYALVNGQAGIGIIGGQFSIRKKIGSIQEGLSGIFSNISGDIGYQYGVYGGFISIGIEITGEWFSSLSSTGKDCGN
jgi:hypothetical protein